MAVITGGASGMGRATALRFLDEGARVVVADLNEENGKELVNEASGAGHGDAVRFVRTDVADESDIEAMIRATVEAFGRLDVCGNAGVGGAFGPITDTTVEDWDWTMGVLLRSVFLGIKHGARQMKSQGDGGVIVSTSSVAGLFAQRHRRGTSSIGGRRGSSYSPCRRRSSWPSTASVNAVCPGAINTLLINMGNPEAMGGVFDTVQPWPRTMVLRTTRRHGVLASADGEFVTGEALVVDGGYFAAGPGLFRRTGQESALANAAGVHRGSTGAEHTFRALDEEG
ncbi:MAG: SDR family oxidoreductase [Acidimicrobiia bacterium]|nr:SDR family oxidoreductase [Acidimicrobiia bacterium]